MTHNFEILTPDGWKDFDGIQKVSRPDRFEITLESGKSFGCSTDHHIEVKDHGWVSVEWLEPGIEIKTKDGYEYVKSVDYIEGQTDLFDPLNVRSDNHAYLANGVVHHNCHFLGSANTLISGTKLRSLAYKTPKLEQDGLSVYYDPEPDHEYMTICDVSRGTRQDYSAFTVIDITQVPYKIVAVYRDNEIPPMVYPEVIHRVASRYNESWIMVETNDAGIQVAESLYEDYEYENMIMTSMKGRKGQVADSGFGSGKSQRGVKTTKSVKRIGCSILKDLIENDKLLIDDYHTIQELSTFIAKAGSYEADVGHNDDLAMCLVLFGWVTTQPIYRDIMSMDTRKILYEERLQQIEDQWAPFGFVNDGISDPEDTFVDSEGDRWTTADRKHEKDDWF